MSDERRSGTCACQGVGPMVTNVIHNLAPVEAGKHFRAARVEFLKGIRSLIDSRIEKLSRSTNRDDAGTAVPVD